MTWRTLYCFTGVFTQFSMNFDRFSDYFRQVFQYRFCTNPENRVSFLSIFDGFLIVLMPGSPILIFIWEFIKVFWIKFFAPGAPGAKNDYYLVVTVYNVFVERVVTWSHDKVC